MSKSHHTQSIGKQLHLGTENGGLEHYKTIRNIYRY